MAYTIIFFPFVLLHELSHMLFLYAFGVLRLFRFEIRSKSLGFYPIDDGAEVSLLQSYGMVIAMYAPVIPFVTYWVLGTVHVLRHDTA